MLLWDGERLDVLNLIWDAFCIASHLLLLAPVGNSRLVSNRTAVTLSPACDFLTYLPGYDLCDAHYVASM
jgi:hypothetical protein